MRFASRRLFVAGCWWEEGTDAEAFGHCQGLPRAPWDLTVGCSRAALTSTGAWVLSG